MSDLKDYLYEHDSILDLVEQDIEINKKDRQSDKKTLFDGIMEEEFKDKNSAKRFDQLDFIIIDVPAHVLPWQQKSN